MFDDCIKDGLVTILGMQDLITADITVDGGKIDERRKGLLAWAGEAQTKMATILKQVRVGVYITWKRDAKSKTPL